MIILSFAGVKAITFADENKQEMKAWYDGFTFGSVTDIYNPWSVTNYLDKGKLEPYWANSSANELISHLIAQGTPEIKSFLWGPIRLTLTARTKNGVEVTKQR